MAATVSASPYPGADLLEVVRRAVEREGHLLTAGERVVCDRILGLDAAAAELFARLTLREGQVFRLSGLRYEVTGAWPTLVDAGLVTTTFSDDAVAEAFDAEALRAACVRLGLPRGGSRAVLEARLKGRRWVDEPLLVVGHRPLLRRLERFAGMDRQLLVAERLELVKWPVYTPTGGPGLFPDRRALRTWERARAGAWTDPDEPRRLAAQGPRPFGPSPYAAAVDALLASDPPADVLADIPGEKIAWVRALEREGRGGEAVEVCRKGDRDPAVDLALRRTGARLARKLARAWPPARPLAEAPVRRLRLPRTGGGTRPRWGEEKDTVEAAVVRMLHAIGRHAHHGENGMWTSLFALVFRPLYWLPIPGRLPTARRSGPLDLGTPAFYEARRDAVEARLASLSEEGLVAACAGWSGEVLDGLRNPHMFSLIPLVPTPMAEVVLGRLAREGWGVARGLPDLFVPPGPPVRIDAAIPPSLGEDAILVEVKGPTDALRDEQRVWIDLFLRRSIHVEIWEVRDK